MKVGKSKNANKEEVSTKRKIKRPKFIIFTDKDGTLNLEDEELNNIFKLVNSIGGMVIPITGRTVGDIQEEMKRQKIKTPAIIIGDNGAAIYSTSTREFLVKKTLEHDKVMEIVDNFIQFGGTKDFIRYTNGGTIYAQDCEDVRNYYSKNKAVEFCQDIYESISQAENISKLTLAGTEEQMVQSSDCARGLDFWTDQDKTKFPAKKYNNHRLDVSQKNINKGEAVNAVVSSLKPKYGYMCVGNGNNDIAMFQKAIDDEMIVAIMGDASPELINEIREYSLKNKKGRVITIPKDKDLANTYILRFAKAFQSHIKKEENLKRTGRKKTLPNIQRVSIKHPSQRENLHSKSAKNKIPKNGGRYL